MSYFNLVLSFGGLALFANEEIHNTLKISKMKTSMYEITMEEIIELLKKESTRETLLQNFIGMATRTFMKESFEIIRKYC